MAEPPPPGPRPESEGPATPPSRRRVGVAVRGLAIDLSPLRTSRSFRQLWIGELISTTGRQITVVALPFQIFVRTGSSLAVGMIGLVQVVPLIAASILGGAVVDRLDRRKLILWSETALAATSGLLLLGAIHGEPPLWYLYSVAGLQAAFFGINTPTRSAVVPNLVPREQLSAALALGQVLFTATLTVGPVLAGFILGFGRGPEHQLGLTFAYGVDVATFLAAITAAFLLPPLPPIRAEGEPPPVGFKAIREGFAYLRGKKVLNATFLIDLDAMIFGMPRALFPVLALDVFHVGPHGLGLLYAAPAAGALIGALTTGWVGRVKHQGRAVIWAVIAWGAAITLFGLSGTLFWLALGCLGVAGAADVISAVFRGTILQLSVPDALRGRLSAVHIMVVTGGPRVGDVEAGAVAALVSPRFSVVSGGVACIAGAVLLAVLVPELARYHAGDPPEVMRRQ